MGRETNQQDYVGWRPHFVKDEAIEAGFLLAFPRDSKFVQDIELRGKRGIASA